MRRSLLLVLLPAVACSSRSGDLVVDRVIPSSAMNTANVAVTIEGSGFQLPIVNDLDEGKTYIGQMMVLIGDVPLADAVRRGEQQIDGVVLAGQLDVGTYNVTVQLGNRSQTLLEGYTVLGDQATPPDAPPDAPGDRDADTVIDSSDNCPDLANADQADHDADLRGDVCDHCPHLSSTTDPDLDGDGVGDACDPRPSLSGDARALWIGFYDSDATIVAGWTKVGTWSVANGMLSKGTSVASFEYARAPMNVTRPYAATAVQLDTQEGTTWTAGVGTPPTTGGYYECYIYSGGSGGLSGTGPWVAAQGGGGFTAKARSTIAPGNMNFIVRDLTSNLDCTFTEEGTTFMETASRLAGSLSGPVQVSGQRAKVSFDYLFVVSAGP